MIDHRQVRRYLRCLSDALRDQCNPDEARWFERALQKTAQPIAELHGCKEGEDGQSESCMVRAATNNRAALWESVIRIDNRAASFLTTRNQLTNDPQLNCVGRGGGMVG